MGDSFYMRLYTKEYLSDSKVRALSREHRADLVDLWCHCDQEGSIPLDPQSIGRLLGLAPAVARRTMEALRPFFQEEDGRLYSPRQRKERQAREAESLKKRGGAQKTNAKRWGFPSLSDTEATRLAMAERPLSDSLSVSLKGRQSVVSSQYSPSLRSGEGCSEAGEPPAVPSPLLPPEPVVLSLPCVGKGPKEWPVTQRQIDQWAEAFPGVSILPEVRKMRLWLQDPSHAARRKTYKGTGAFVLNWLGKAQNQGLPTNGRASPLTVGTSRTPAADEALTAQIKTMQFPTLASLSGGHP